MCYFDLNYVYSILGLFSSALQLYHILFAFFFFNDTATTEIYTLSLHDALPISRARLRRALPVSEGAARPRPPGLPDRSEEHTSELQSLRHLVCRLLLEKKKKKKQIQKRRSI